MYIYEIINYFYDEKESDNVYGYSYVIHKEKYSNKEFRYLCEEAKKQLGEKGIYGNDISEYLIKNYGFENMPIESSFEYDIDEE